MVAERLTRVGRRRARTATIAISQLWTGHPPTDQWWSL